MSKDPFQEATPQVRLYTIILALLMFIAKGIAKGDSDIEYLRDMEDKIYKINEGW